MLGLLKKAAAMMKIERADLPELPPPDFRNLPPGPGFRIQYFDSLDDLGRWARENHISANDAYNPKRFMGGVAMQAKVIGLPRPGLLRDHTLDDRLYIHEVGAHSNGLEHAPGGHGWGVYGPDRQFYPAQSRAQQAELLARLYPPAPATFDWSGKFSRPMTTTPATDAAAPRQMTAGH